MTLRRWRRKVRCLLKYGPRGCPHIERHSRRSRRRPPPGVAPPTLTRSEAEEVHEAAQQRPPRGRHVLS